MERDHIWPKSLGGGDDPRNIQYLCPACHHKKTSAEARRWPVPERAAIRARLRQQRQRRRRSCTPGCLCFAGLVALVLLAALLR